ncbi:MAG TPA: hypothetical protein V6C97_12745 [Oculatellaceae cyanobacterium]
MSTTTEQYNERSSMHAPQAETFTDRIVMVAIIITSMIACIAIGVAVSSRPYSYNRMVGTAPDYYGRPSALESTAPNHPISKNSSDGSSFQQSAVDRARAETGDASHAAGQAVQSDTILSGLGRH